MPFIAEPANATPVQKKTVTKTPKAPKKSTALSKALIDKIGSAVSLFRQKNDKTLYHDVSALATDFELDDLSGTIKAHVAKGGTSFIPFRHATEPIAFSFRGVFDTEKVFTSDLYETAQLILGFTPDISVEPVIKAMCDQLTSTGYAVNKATSDLLDGDMKLKLKLDDKLLTHFDDGIKIQLNTASTDEFVYLFLEFAKDRRMRIDARFGVSVLEPSERSPDYTLGIYINVRTISVESE